MDNKTILDKISKLESKKAELLKQYASFNQELQEIANETIRIDGAIRELKSIISEEPKEVK
jgi:regulator of replication initiation timing